MYVKFMYNGNEYKHSITAADDLHRTVKHIIGGGEARLYNETLGRYVASISDVRDGDVITIIPVAKAG